MEPKLPCEALPEIADHTLLQKIGRGGFGEVWLTRTIIGSFRAAKIVGRRNFADDRPFTREFDGIRNYEPISRSHQGLVTVLQIGQNAEAGYFYYLMELADDALTGTNIDPANYTPRTLHHDLATHHSTPLKTKLEKIALPITEALRHLHNCGLVHCDIKPANIIFVNGSPKLADVGLVSKKGQASSVGSSGYMPPEGPGAVTADIYSLGKVLYELFMGKPVRDFPDPPSSKDDFDSVPALLKLNRLVLKASHPDPKKRFQSADELHQELLCIGQKEGWLPQNNSGTEKNPAAFIKDADKRLVVCFIDDDEKELQLFENVFGNHFKVLTGTRSSEALAEIERFGKSPHLFILDLYFATGRGPTAEERETMVRLRSEVDAAARKLTDYLALIGQDRSGGLKLLHEVHAKHKNVPAVFYTRKGTLEDVGACLEAGAMDVIRKPQPHKLDPEADTFSQLEAATLAHRDACLARFESFCSSRNFARKCMNAVKFLFKNWAKL